jgi:CheY-like chemotaxis protein
MGNCQGNGRAESGEKLQRQPTFIEGRLHSLSNSPAKSCFQPALIVTDLSMPLMNGLEETRILKKLMPAVPVILYSAHIDSFVEKEAVAAGASAVVNKSDNVAVLIGKAREILDEIAA